MEIGLKHSTFIRHSEDETLLWNVRNYACQVIRNAEGFLRPLIGRARPFEDIVKEIAVAYGVAESEVESDVREFYTGLIHAGLVVGQMSAAESRSDSTPCDGNMEKTEPQESTGGGDENDELPIGAFYRRHGLPAELHIDLTSGCTERCIHCYIPDYSPRYLPKDTVFKVLREFREAQGLTVLLSGGECMMHPDFDEIVRCARQLDLNIIILSNLTLCDAARIKVLAEVHPQFVNVSVYSMDAAIHDGITRLRGSWKKTMDAIERLRAADVGVRIASPAMKQNKDGFAALKKFAESVHAHLIPDCDIVGKMDHDCTNKTRCALDDRELETLLREWKQCGIWEYSAVDATRVVADAKVCDVGEGKLCVNADGIYYPCEGCHGIVLGDAHKDTLMDVWRGEKLNALRALRNCDFGECATCANRAWCKVCFARNFNETGDMFTHLPERCRLAAVKRKVFEET